MQTSIDDRRVAQTFATLNAVFMLVIQLYLATRYKIQDTNNLFLFEH